MMARWVIDLSPGTEIVPCKGRPGMIVKDAIWVLRGHRESRREFLSFLPCSFECLLDACGIAHSNELLQLAQRALIGLNERDHIVAVPEENIAPRFRGTSGNPGRIPQPATRVAYQIEGRNLLIANLSEGIDQCKGRHMRQMAHRPKNLVMQMGIHRENRRSCFLPHRSDLLKRLRIRRVRRSDGAARS